jgi:hypothetical protein
MERVHVDRSDVGGATGLRQALQEDLSEPRAQHRALGLLLRDEPGCAHHDMHSQCLPLLTITWYKAEQTCMFWGAADS